MLYREKKGPAQCSGVCSVRHSSGTALKAFWYSRHFSHCTINQHFSRQTVLAQRHQQILTLLLLRLCSLLLLLLPQQLPGCWSSRLQSPFSPPHPQPSQQKRTAPTPQRPRMPRRQRLPRDFASNLYSYGPMAYTVMADIVMAYTAMADMVMAYTAMADIVMAESSHRTRRGRRLRSTNRLP